jgi:predicted membrane protein (TIGR00267 family)
MRREKPSGATTLKDLILGGQDGLVNVLGLVLGVATATYMLPNATRLVIIAGLSGTVAESLSMAAVAYTSSKAARDFYSGILKRNHNKASTTRKFSSLFQEYSNPLRSAIIVGLASVVGSIIPLITFFFMPVKQAAISSVAIALVILFSTGAYKSKLTGVGNWFKSGIEMMLIGGLAAIAGFAVGKLLEML